MKADFFKSVAKIGHLQHQTQIPVTIIKLLILIQGLQYLGLLLPKGGWAIWTYKDVYLKLLSNISHFFLGVPLLVESDLSTLAFILTVLSLTFQLLLLLSLFIMAAYSNFAQSAIFQSLIYYYSMLISQVMLLPCLSLYLAQIFCGEKESFYKSCKLDTKLFINILGLILFKIILISGQYFLRPYTFQPFNKLQQRYDLVLPVVYCLNFALILISNFDSNDLTNYAKITVLILIFTLQIRQLIIQQPQVPELNAFSLRIVIVLGFNTLTVAMNVLSANTIFPEEHLLVFLMVSSTFGFVLSDKILMNFRSVQYSSLDVLSSTRFCIELYDFYSRLKENSKQFEYFLFQFYVSKHLRTCDKNCANQRKKNQKSLNQCKPVIFCILSNQLLRAKQSQKVHFEELQLAYVSFLGSICKKPLFAYVELKRYEILRSNQSFYFKKMRHEINQYLSEMIARQQFKSKQGQNQLQTEKSLEIHDIMKSTDIQYRFIPRFIEILDKKVNLWNEQIKGFNSIYDLEQTIKDLSSKILKLQIDLQAELSINLTKLEHISLQTNVIEIKIAALYFSSIVNDYYSTSICETTITEIFNVEHTLSNEIITNLKLVEDKVALIMLSMVKNRGLILNPDKKGLALYFGYDDSEFQRIQSIDQLMPHFLADIHDSLLQDYLQTAKSIFFNAYVPVFSQSKEGFLISQQLKIGNNFQILDDYVLIGCMSQIHQGYDYVIFGDDGRILGMTQGFYDTIIQNQENNQGFSVKRAIQQLYIQMFLPTIIQIVQEYKSRKNNDYQITLQDYCLLWAHANLKEIIALYQAQNISVPGRHTSHLSDKYSSFNSYKQKNSEPSLSQAQETNNMIYSQLGDPSVQEQTIGKVEEVPLYNPQYQMQIQQFLQLLDAKNQVKFLMKYSLSYSKIGRDDHQKSYFVLEVFELRKKDLLAQGDSLNYNSMSIQNNKYQSQQANTSDLATDDIPFKEITPNQQDKLAEYTHLIQRYGKPSILSQKHQGLQQQITHQFVDNMDSGRDSLSYGPLSQRVNFISPSSKQVGLEEILDQELQDIQVQIEGALNYSKAIEFQAELELQEQSQQKGQTSEQQNKPEDSNKLLKLLQLSKKQQQMGKEEEEFGAQKSRSSATSGTSGISAIQIIKKFQQKTQMIGSLKTITLINIFAALTIGAFIGVHLVIITANNQQTLDTIIDINGPLRFNEYFLRLFSQAWSMVYNALGVIDSSEFMITTFIRQLKANQLTFYTELNSLYNTFISVEERNLISLISLDFLYQENEMVKFTYFSNFISNTATILFEAGDRSLDTIDELIDKIYMDNLLTLRYNIKNVIAINSQLLNALNQLFFEQLNTRLSQMQTQIILEIILFALIFFSQIYFWKQLEQYCQQILLLIGRLQETQATDMITRSSFVRETLTITSGKYAWKKQNYYQVGYLPVNQLNLENFSTQTKVIKDFQYKSSHVQQQNTNNKKTLSVVLNSRIYKTQITIWFPITFVSITFIIFMMFIVGGYILVNSQSNELQPSQQLIMDFIQFSFQFNIVTTASLVVKTQPILYQRLIDLGVYTQAEIDSFRDQRVILKLLIQYKASYSENITTIYENVLSSQKISDAQKATLFKIYEDDFCNTVGEKIRFCNYNDNFIRDYGQYTYIDDNREYLSQGIIGVVSRINTLTEQIFQYEFDKVDYLPDKQELVKQVSTREFTSAIIQHFIDTTDGTNFFLELIQESVRVIMQNDLQATYLYYLLAGILIEIIFLSAYIYWFHHTNKRLIRIRLALVNLPIEILTESHTLSILKRLN